MHLVNQDADPPSRKRGGSDVPCKGRVFLKAEVMRSTDGASTFTIVTIARPFFVPGAKIKQSVEVSKLNN